jgi:hypothetical protein
MFHPAGSEEKNPAEVIFINFIKCFDTNGDGQISRQ